jgi:hypothetical protein
LLAKIAAKSKWLEVRITAIGKVTDQILLRQLSEKEPQAAIRQASVVRIADDNFLLKRFSADSSAAVRAAIVETLREKDSLCRIALTAYYQENRTQAIYRLQKEFYDPVPDVITAHNELVSRVKGLSDENDNVKLLTLVLEGEFDVLRVSAARRLSDPAMLERVGMHVTDRDVLKIVLTKIEDNAMLNRLAADAADPSMRLAAALKSGAKS